MIRKKLPRCSKVVKSTTGLWESCWCETQTGIDSNHQTEYNLDNPVTYGEHRDSDNSNGSIVLSSTNFEENIADYDIHSFDALTKTIQRDVKINKNLAV